MALGYRPLGVGTSERFLASSGRQRGLGSRMDWLLAAAVFALAGIGLLLVWSATRPRLEAAGDDPQSFLKKQLLNIVIGVALGLACSLFDYRMLRVYAPFIYLLSILGLVLVLTPVGATINGSHSWIVLGGGFSVQPSEFAKVALVAGLAMLLAERRDNEEVPRATDMLMALALAGLPVALVMLQPDLGTVMVLLALVVGVLAMAGTKLRWLIGLAALGIGVSITAIQLGVLEDYQVNRFAAFANPELDPRGVGYNANQARIAIGSGGLFGKGLFEGSQTAGQFVPEQQTDFIYTVAGEELGFVGGIVIIGLFAVILWRAGRIARHADDLFGALVAAGVICWFAFQVFENVGMTLGIMPITGLPLPFVSYGGSAMFASFMAVGLLQNVHVRSAS